MTGVSHPAALTVSRTIMLAALIVLATWATTTTDAPAQTPEPAPEPAPERAPERAPEPTPAQASPPAKRPPQRVVSLDYCADQYVLKFVDRDRIAALSPQADDAYSYMRQAAKGLRQVRPTAENVLALQPDLIVRSYGGGPRALAFFERLGLPVVQIGWASNLDQAIDMVGDVASQLGAQTAGKAVMADMRARLNAINADPQTPHTAKPSVMYLTPGGVTTGPGSLMHEVMQAAGATNYQTRPGWRSLPLEALVSETPDVFLTSFFRSKWGAVHAWSAARHPVMQNALASGRRIDLDPALTSCAGWPTIDAVEAIAMGLGHDQPPQGLSPAMENTAAPGVVQP